MWFVWRSLGTRWTAWANRATSRRAPPWTRPDPIRPTAIIMPSSIHGPEAAIRRQGPMEFITANGRKLSRDAKHEIPKSITDRGPAPSPARIIRPSTRSHYYYFFFFYIGNSPVLFIFLFILPFFLIFALVWFNISFLLNFYILWKTDSIYKSDY